MPVIIIDYRDHRPIYEQIIDRFRELILKGALEPDSQLPSVRNLAIELSINPNTIQRAYAELERQGYIYSMKGKGNFIAANQQLFQEKRKDLFNNFEKLVKAAKGMGISKEQLVIIVNDGYREGKEND